MANKQHAQFSDENGNIFYLENETEDVLDPSGKPLSNGGDLSEASVTFTPDATRKLPQSGGRFKAFLGSIVKFLSDLTEVAFTGNYSDLEGKPTIPPLANNCTTTAAGYGLDARQGKVLMDKANQLSSEMIWKNLGMVVGPEKLVLPSVFRELWITIAPLSTSATRYTLHIIYDNLPELESEYKRYRTGYAANSNDTTGVSVMISKKDAYIEDLFSAGDNYTDTACMRIFYR